MQEQATKTLNEVDVGRLSETIEQVRSDPGLGRFRFRAKTSWEGGARARTEFQEFYGAGREDDSRSQPLELAADEPPVLLGDNTAPNAVEAVLHALTSCLAVGFTYNAAAEGIEIRSLDFEIEGDIDLHTFLGLNGDQRAGYEKIRVRYDVDADASREKIEELCSYVQRTSPVLDVLRNPVPVDVSLKG
jgi:uncharacterized OsmC-like protein